MFTADNDEEEDSSVSIMRYPCMPSLMALQQMKNRLHLARLGKKLMKWTAIATGQELHKLAQELDDSYKSFKMDMCNAFMLVARARYFYPNLNKMVLENLGCQAVVTVDTSMRSVSGVKVLQLNVVESSAEPYVHLGIEKGGEAIREAKLCWLAILKRLILMLQMRTNFEQVQAANQTATKRKNVLIKIVIPKIRKSIQYIIAELEEIAREELFRIKKIEQNKRKKGKKIINHEKPGYTCPICGYTVTKGTIQKSNESFEDKNKELQSLLENGPVPKKDIRVLTEVPGDMYIPLSRSKEAKKPLDTMNLTSADVTSTDIMDCLKKQLNKIVTLSGNLVNKGFVDIDLATFSKICEAFELTLENTSKTEKLVHGHLTCTLENLESKLRDVINMVQECRDESFLSPSFQQFARICQDTDEKINICLKKVESNPSQENVNSQLKKLNSYIDNVVKLTKECKKDTLLTSSMKEFLNSSKAVKLKIDKYLHENVDVEKYKIDHLKEHVTDLEYLATHVQQEGIATSSLENFIASCKNFKAKIDERKMQDKNSTTEGGLDKLINHIVDTIKLSKNVKESRLMSGSIENFIKSCEDIKKKIEIKGKIRTDVQELQTLNDLRYNINDIVNIISKSKEQGLLMPSIDDFVKSCEETKTKIDFYEKFPPETGSEGKMLYAICSKACTCGTSEAPLDELCDRCMKLLKEESNDDQLIPPPCSFCQGIVKEESYEELLCDSCNQVPLEKDIEFPAYISPEQSKENVCDICKDQAEDDVKESMLPEEEAETETVDSSLGYFEKKVRKITRIKRIQNLDGTIREEKETIVIKREKHDPNETTMIEDDTEFDDISDESLLDDGKDETKNVGICITGNQNQKGFITIVRYVQSDVTPSSLTMAEPSLRQCISELTLRRQSTVSKISSICL